MRDTYFRYKAILIDISWFASCFTRGMGGGGVKQNSLKTLKHFYASLGITFQSDLPTLVLDQKNACYFIFILAAMPPKVSWNTYTWGGNGESRLPPFAILV